MISNKTWMKIHLYLSLFFLPMALIYAVTGAFYIFGYGVNAGANTLEIKIKDEVNHNNAKDIMINLIKENNLKMPDDTSVKFARNTYSMGTLSNKYLIKLGKDEHRFLSFDRNLYGVLLLLHKSNGGFWFDILAVGFAVALAIFYISGLFLTAFCKRDKKGALISTILGIVITTLCVYFSI